MVRLKVRRKFRSHKVLMWASLLIAASTFFLAGMALYDTEDLTKIDGLRNLTYTRNDTALDQSLDALEVEEKSLVRKSLMSRSVLWGIDKLLEFVWWSARNSAILGYHAGSILYPYNQSIASVGASIIIKGILVMVFAYVVYDVLMMLSGT